MATYPIRSPGMESDLELDFEIIESKPGDIFLLCSDGLTSMVSDEDILHIIIKRKKDLQKAVEDLIKAAKVAGGKDNITAILAEV